MTLRIRNPIHITIILAGTLVAVAGAALYGVGFIGLGCVLLFCGTIAAAATNAHRDCRNQRV
jgi:hypothetical protein